MLYVAACAACAACFSNKALLFLSSVHYENNFY